MCLAQGFSPKTYKFKWFQDGKQVTNQKNTYDSSEKNDSRTLYSALSIFQISAETWQNPDTKVKCEFEHKARNQVKEAQYAGMFSLEDCEKLSFSISLFILCLPFPKYVCLLYVDPSQDCSDITLEIVPPSLEDMLKNRAGMLMCKASGNNPGFTKIEITASGSVIALETSEAKFKNKYEVVLTARIGYEEWSNGTTFTCTAEHSQLAQPKETTFTRENGMFFLFVKHHSIFASFLTIGIHVKLLK